tara:strand:- start:30 stop:635 length:606 start_codon:yes stop_codon:yes gene_type:complete
MKNPIKLIAGLGNPGSEYEGTRHNAGADFVRMVAAQHQVTLQKESKFFGVTGIASISERAVRLLIPATFMNHSGQSIAALAGFYKILPSEIMIVHDELDLLPGTARFKLGGGHGGHNGLRDSIRCLGNSRDFARLRIGIGHPGNAKLVTDYVLKRAPHEEYDRLLESAAKSLHWLPSAVSGDWEKAMTGLHSDLEHNHLGH